MSYKGLLIILLNIYLFQSLLGNEHFINFKAETRCKNSRVGYYADDNVEINNGTPIIVMKNLTENQCLRYCTKNQDNKGKAIECSYAVYDLRSAMCHLYPTIKIQESDVNRHADEGRQLFEKFCLPDDLPNECTEQQFVRINEYILKGYAETTATFSTLAECVAHCVREKEFQCKSAMYFYEEGECITNSESAITKPEDFMRPEDDEKVIFVHNGCIDHFSNSAKRPLETNKEIALSVDENSSTISNKESSTNLTLNSTPLLRKISNIIELPTTLTTNITETTVDTTLFSKELMHKTQNYNDSQLNRLHAAVQLPKSITNLTESTQGKNEPFMLSENSSFDKGPEHAASGQVAVEDIVEQQLTSRKSTDMSSFTKEKSNKPPGIAPPESKFAFMAISDINENDQKKFKNTNHARNNNVPHAVVPKISDAQIAREALLAAQVNLITSTPIINPLSTETKITTASLKVPSDITEAPISTLTHMEIQKLTTSTVRENRIPLHNNIQSDTVIESKISIAKIEQLKTSKDDNISSQNDWALFSNWSNWTPCRIQGERRIRRRKCLDLRQCRGALMQVDYCSMEILPTQTANLNGSKESLAAIEQPVGPPVQNLLPITTNTKNEILSVEALPPSILPNKLPEKTLKPLPRGAPGRPTDVWSPWLGICQQFVSVQPCKHGRMIGFESRECIAKDPTTCQGPFFRYCTLSC